MKKSLTESLRTAQVPTLTLSGIRFFEHYPQETTRLLCGTRDDLPCILVGVDNTADDDGRIEQAQPIHLRCMVDSHYWRINRDVGVIYARII